jgi:uncharacterized protein (TIGR02284 family)
MLGRVAPMASTVMMSNLMTSVVGPAGSAPALAVAGPVAARASVPEASERLRLDHEELAASLSRLRSFALAEDRELAVGEWGELESSILQHIDAEEMFLLPEYARAQPQEAAALVAEHREIRATLGQVGLAIDLHTLRLEQIDAVSKAVLKHVAREESTLYPWAREAAQSALVDAVLRRLPRATPHASREARTTTTLLTLLQVGRDGEQGYRRAAVDAERPAHRTLFTRLAEDRARFGRQLRAELKSLGVAAQFKGTVFGALHRGWIETTSRLAHGKTGVIFRECERGEELALRAYRAALRTDLPAALRGSIELQYAELERAVSEIRACAATL